MSLSWREGSAVNNSFYRHLQEKYLSGKLRPNELDNTGLSLLHKAALEGQLTCFKWLIQQRGDPRLRSKEGSVPAHYAAGGGHLKILQYLYEICKESISYKDKCLAAPLFIAAQEGQIDCLIWLTKTSSISPNDKTIDGMTPSHACAQEGELDCLRYLIKVAHAHEHAVDNNGCTLLHYAAAEGRAKVSIWLIEHCNLDCNAEDVNGSTSLHLAARSGHKRTLQVLLKCGAKTDARDNQGKTALDYAVLNEKQDCVTLLKQTMEASTTKGVKKVRFNNLVYTSDSGTHFSNNSIINHNSNRNRRQKKARKNLFDEEEINSQMNFWTSPEYLKQSKQPHKNKKNLYKGPTKHIDKDENQDKVEIVVKDFKPVPDLLKHLNESSPPKVPVRSGASKIPKELMPRSQNKIDTYHVKENVETSDISTDLSDSTKSDSVEISTKPQLSSSSSSFSLDEIKSPTRKAIDKKKRRNIANWSPPAVPKRQNGVNLNIVKQNSIIHSENDKSREIKSQNTKKIEKTITYPNHFFAREKEITEANKKLAMKPASGLNSKRSATYAPTLRPTSSNTIELMQLQRDKNQYIKTDEILKYLPKSYVNKKLGLENNLNRISKNRNFTYSRYNTHTYGNKYTNIKSNKLLQNQDNDSTALIAGSPKLMKEEYYFDRKKASTWSTIRHGVTSFFNTLRPRKLNQDDRWIWMRAPRADIFSRFSINRKTEFDDLFNSSTEGIYKTSEDQNTTTTQGKSITSLQDGYEADVLSRFREQALDQTLRGTSNYVQEEQHNVLKSQISPNTARTSSTSKITDKDKAFIW